MILSNRLANNLSQTNIKPIMVLEIDGVPFLIGSDTIKRQPRYGDEGLFYGDEGLFYNGLTAYPNQKTLITLDGTTTSIRQSLEPDKARSSTISNMTLKLIDKNGVGTDIVGGLYGEVLFKKVKVWVSFGEQTAWNEDFLIVFRGRIESASADQGFVTLSLSSPDQKKRSSLYIKGDDILNGAIDATQTSLILDDATNFFVIPEHPLYGGQDTQIQTAVKIEDEIITYTGKTGNELTGVSRGAFATTPAAHDDEIEVEGFVYLEGNAMELALKILMSDAAQTPYISGELANRVNYDGISNRDDTIFFADVDFTRDRQVLIGDYVQTTGFTNGSNNLSSWTEVLDVGVNDAGSFIVLDATLTVEPTTSGTVDFLSKWNSFGSFGLGLDQDEIDIEKHVQLRNSFLSGYTMRFYVKDDIENGKEFIEKELYLPTSCYSLPTDREGLARTSVGIHKPPIPGTGIVTVGQRNLKDPDKLGIKRSVNKNYYSAVVTKYEDSPIDEELRRKKVTLVGTPQVPEAGEKTLVIESLGLKSFYNAKFLAEQSHLRLLQRYESAAEFINGAKIHFRDGVTIVPGDIIVFDPTNLNQIDNATQTRNKPPLLMEVVNRSVDIKKGDCSIDLVSTAFNIDAKFGLISPASKVASVLTNSRFIITYQYAPSVFGSAEYRKWNRLQRPGVRIRRPDFSEVHNTVLISATSNTVQIETAPSFSIQPGDIMEFSSYSTTDVSDEQKLVYCFLTDNSNDFPDGGKPYVFI